MVYLALRHLMSPLSKDEIAIMVCLNSHRFQLWVCHYSVSFENHCNSGVMSCVGFCIHHGEVYLLHYGLLSTSPSDESLKQGRNRDHGLLELTPFPIVGLPL